MENAKNSKKFSGKRKAVIASMTGDAVSALRITAVTWARMCEISIFNRWGGSFCANLGPSFRPESVVCGAVQALGGAPLALEEVPLGLEGTAPSLDFGTVLADLAVGGVAKEELPLAGLEENWPSDCLFSTLSGISSKSQEKLYSQDSGMLATFEIFERKM